MMNEAMEESAEGKFFIRSGDESFKNRQNGVFDQLGVLEDKHSVAVSAWKNEPGLKFEEEDEEVENCNFGPKPDFSSKVANAELFKVPIGVPPKRIARPSGTPDYSVHPEKWTKYTLSDVTQESLSEDANSEAAMDFLKSRWKAGNDYQEPSAESPECEPSGSSTKLEFGKFLMPEYSVGKSSGKPGSPAKRQRRSEEDSAAPKVKLSFLNSICPSKSEDAELDAGEGVENKAPMTEGEEVDPKKLDGKKPALPESNELFRAIRKRRRNFRQATLPSEEEASDI